MTHFPSSSRPGREARASRDVRGPGGPPVTRRVGEFHPRPAGSLDFPFWTMTPPSCVSGAGKDISQETNSTATSSVAGPSGEATSSKATSSEATSSEATSRKATTSEGTSKHQADWKIDKNMHLHIWGTAKNLHIALGPPPILGKRKMTEQAWQDYD